MDIFIVIEFLGGLAIFLFGMSILSTGLEKLSSGKLERILESLTSNVFKSVLLGAFVTAAVQSSSATTVIIVGLVNARILKLKQAIGVIMGANIGTTITAHILSLADISSDNIFLKLIKPSSLAPIAAIIGIAMVLLAKKAKQKEFGQILLGFATLFTGMFAMEDSVRILRDLPEFAELFATLSNPVLGVIAGALVTAVIQSSSASVGILQALSTTGQITCASAFPIIMGQNIGTCITPILASIGASTNAKRSAFVHLSFNIIGTTVFLIALYTVNAIMPFSFWNSAIDRSGIALFHTFFNVLVTVLFIPFVNQLEKLAIKTIKSNESEMDTDDIADVLDDRFLQSPGLAIQYSEELVIKMSQFARQNLVKANNLFKAYDQKEADSLAEIETVLDKLEDRLNIYLLKLSKRELTQAEGEKISLLLHMINEYERIGDYAVNIAQDAQNIFENNVVFSKFALKEMDTVVNATLEILDLANDCFINNDEQKVFFIEPLEEVIDSMEEMLKNRHIDRLKNGECELDSAFPFIETLSSLERIADHCSNIGIYIALFDDALHSKDLNMHNVIEELKNKNQELYTQNQKLYKDKYYSIIDDKQILY